MQFGTLFTSFYFCPTLSRRRNDFNAAVFLSFFFYVLSNSVVTPTCDVFMRVLLELYCSCKQIFILLSVALSVKNSCLSHKHFHTIRRWQHDFNSSAQVGSVVIWAGRRRNQCLTRSALIALTVQYRRETCQHQREQVGNVFRWKTSIHVLRLWNMLSGKAATKFVIWNSKNHLVTRRW